jgi:flavorubredoxin
MNTPQPITDDIYWVGANDRQTEFFEALWPLPTGISYNSYLIHDKKTALIDGIKADFLGMQIDRIHQVLNSGTAIDYLVINHMEPDHTGALQVIRSLFPRMLIVGNSKTIELLGSHYGIADNLLVVHDHDVLDLGRHTITFRLTPMVHWPETMMTYDMTDRVLFSGDMFGGFGAVDTELFDGEADTATREQETLRYFSNVIGRYSAMVQNALAKIRSVDPAVVAPTHGIIWTSDPHKIISLYDRWSSHQTDPAVVIAYASMYGTTYSMVEALAGRLVKKKVPVVLHDLVHSHASYVLRDIWRCKGVIFACPTYNTGLFPLMENLIHLLENKMIHCRRCGIVSTCSWAGGAVDILKDFVKQASWDLVDPVIECKGAPGEKDFSAIDELAQAFASLMQRLC